ncbi:MAG TPA: 30S ribosomal protein S20 [Bacteroidia bacterium]|nr:30S ribosomal protein S20 [Sphingobacteriales bacterium]HPD64152.1 30S ribosomal protein S20 [Bacteroidia bacterium]HRS57892.1 30S ribosomal protein S20 [Bacteroidia bacterium]HRU68468.1 30S ribosomal protein S20 [Bacteroidia bacterium]
MAHHKSALKRIRQNEVRRLRNRYQYKTVRNAIRKFKTIKTKEEALAEYNTLASKIDKLAKTGVIHKNNASNKKSELHRYIAHLA